MNQAKHPSSALFEEDLTDPIQNSGAKNWHDWVDNTLMSIRLNAKTENPHDAIFAILQSPHLRRFFIPMEDETAPMYIERLKREAKAMDAAWFFNVIISPGASHYENEPVPTDIDRNDIDAIMDAVRNGRLSVCLCWHAEFLEDGEHDHSRTGIIPIIGGELGAGTEGQIKPEDNLFAGVLSAE